MKLRELKELIHSDLVIIQDDKVYHDIWCFGPVFEQLENEEVIGIRATMNGEVLISLNGVHHDR